VAQREAPKTILAIAFPPDGKAEWYVTNPDITFEVTNPVVGARYRTLYRWDGASAETEWDGKPINVPSDGQHLLQYRSVAVLSDDFAITPGRTLVPVPRYFTELPRKYLFKLDTTQPRVGSGLTDLFDSRVLITEDYFVNDGSVVLTSAMPGEADGSGIPPLADGKYVLEIDARRLVPGTLSLRTAAAPLQVNVDYKADYYESAGKVFAEMLDGGEWSPGEEVFWQVGVRDIVQYENRDGRQRFVVRFPASPRTVTVAIPAAGSEDTGLSSTEVTSLLLDVSLTSENGASTVTPGPGTFELQDESGRVTLVSHFAHTPLETLFPAGGNAKLRVRGIRNKAGLERVNFIDDGTAFILDEVSTIVYGPPTFALSFNAPSQLLSVSRLDSSIPYDTDLVLELSLESRSETSKFIDFGTYNAAGARRRFSINREQSVWYYARSACPSRAGESVANVVVSDVESGISRIHYTFNGESPVAGESAYTDAPSAVLPAPASYQNRFVFKWLATDRAGNSDRGFFTNVGDALTAPLLLPPGFLTRPIARIHFAPAGEAPSESSPFVGQSGDFIVVDSGVCEGCVEVGFLVLYTDGSRATGATTVCVYNDFLVGSFVPQVVSEFGLGGSDAAGRQWYRGFRPIVVLPIFGPRPSGLDAATPYPSKIFWKWADEDAFKEYAEPFVLRDTGENVLSLYVSFLNGDGVGTESDSFRFTYFWDNERPAVEDSTEPKWLNRDATIFFLSQESGSGVKALLYRALKETVSPPPGSADAMGLVDLNDVAAFFAARQPDLASLQPQDLTDDQTNEYIRIRSLPPVESMDEWALAGGAESGATVRDQRTVGGEVFSGINERIARLRAMDLRGSPFIRLTDAGRYHIAVFAVDNADNVSAVDAGASAQSLRPVFTQYVVQIDRTPPAVSLAFDKPVAVSTGADGTQYIDLDSYPDIDLISIDTESGVAASFYRFGGRNRLTEQTVLPAGAFACGQPTEALPNTGEFARFGGVIKLDASGPEFEDDIFFFATDRAGNRSAVQKAVIRVRVPGDRADTLPPTIRDIVPKSGKVDVSRSTHIQFFIQDDDSGVDIDSVSVKVNGTEFRLDSLPAIQLRYVPPPTRTDVEFLYATVVNDNLILRDNFGVHTFLDGSVRREARLSFDDDRFDTVAEVTDFLGRIPGMTASLSSPSIATLNAKLLRDIENVKVFDRSDPAVGFLTQVTLLSLVEENPQFAFFRRSKGYVVDVNPRSSFDSRSRIDVEVDAKDLVGNPMDTMRMTFAVQEARTRTAEERNDIVRRSKRFFDRLQAGAASNYRKNPFTNAAGLLRADAQEYALMEREAVQSLANARFDTVNARFLYRGFGSPMDVPGTPYISQQAYRVLLTSLRNAYLEGGNPIAMREVLAAWAPGGVEITDFVDFSGDIADQHKIRIAAFYDEATRRHVVTHPDPLKSGLDGFVRDFRPAHLGYGLMFAFGEQFDFQGGCEPTCVTEEGFRATRLIIEPAPVSVTVRGAPSESDIARLRASGLEVCKRGDPVSCGGSALCPEDAVEVRTTVSGLAQRSRLSAIASDPIVLGIEEGRAGCRCAGACGGCATGVPPELSAALACCGNDRQVVWGAIDSIDYSARRYATGNVTVFVDEGRYSVARRTYQDIGGGCDRLPLYECIDFDELQVGDCVVAMGAFVGRTPVFRDGPWFNLWLTPESYSVIRACNPALPEEIAVFDADGNAVGGYVGVDPKTCDAQGGNCQSRTPPYADYQRSVLLSADLASAPSDRARLVPGHTAFREIVAKQAACPESGCEALAKSSRTAICECLLASLQFSLCENTRRDSAGVEGRSKPWRADVTDQWDGSGVYMVRAPLLARSEFAGDLRLATGPREVLAYVDCELADIASFDPIRGAVCIRPAPETGRRVVVHWFGNEYAGVESEKYHFSVHDGGSMDLMDRSLLDAAQYRPTLGEDGKVSRQSSLPKQHIPRAACEPQQDVNDRSSHFFVRNCLIEPNQLQPPEQCVEAEAFGERGYNDSRIEPNRLNRDFFLNAFPGLRKSAPFHAPVTDHAPSACLNFQEFRLRRAWNDTKSAANDPGYGRQEVDFLDGPKLPDRSVDYTELCVCGQYYYGGSYRHVYGGLLNDAAAKSRRRFGFVDHDARIVHYAVEEAVITVPGFACYGYGAYYHGYAYFQYSHYWGCRGATASPDGPTTSGGCPTVFERNPWIAPLFGVREGLFWAAEGYDEPFPIGQPIG
jgi:hypothetical protein